LLLAILPEIDPGAPAGKGRALILPRLPSRERPFPVAEDVQIEPDAGLVAFLVGRAVLSDEIQP